MFTTLLFAIVQGIAELFPVSSLGHAVVLPHILHLNFDIRAVSFLPFLTALHIGTALALLIYFRREWIELLSSLIYDDERARRDSHTLYLLIIGTIPAGILGLIFEKKLAAVFGNYKAAALFLIVNGFVLFGAEKLRRRAPGKDISEISAKHAFYIGASQALALLPGISRSGATLAGGLLVGLTHEQSARFSFLLATPIIFAAGALELPKLLHSGHFFSALIAGLIAGIVAYWSAAFLMKYFKRREVNALLPFGIYCILIGLLTLIIK